jgi:hypothetical protein
MLVFALSILQGCKQKDSAEIEKKSSAAQSEKIDDPLPSWENDSLKQDLIRFVRDATDSTSAGFIPKAARIATFDNDGTLWAERPYVQELFAFFMVKKMVETQPSLAEKQPFKAVISKDKSWFEKGGEKAALQLILETHTGMSQASFDSSVKEFFASASYPGLNVPIRKIVYQPQQELLQYLRDNGFVIFICTGGTVDFVRSISLELYGIPPYQVIGSSFRYEFQDSDRSIVRRSEIVHLNDKSGKPADIQEHIGLRPVFACGNEGGAGDIAMLSYSQGNQYPSFQLLVNHDDSTREFFYQEKDNASLVAAAKNRWHVVSIKKNWKHVFPPH